MFHLLFINTHLFLKTLCKTNFIITRNETRRLVIGLSAQAIVNTQTW